MANVKVAIRVRPLNSREDAGGGGLVVQMEDKIVRMKNTKLNGRPDGRAEVPGDSRERLLEFGFDYCYWSVNLEAPNYASQEDVFQDLGTSVLAGAAEGYNVCLFAYGQTGSGKTYTMMGTPDSFGLTPRICQGLFRSDLESHESQNCRVEVSFLEIYNERVRDLLRGADQKKPPPPLRVREHPEKGPYVQGLSRHMVVDYKQAADLLEVGMANRITAATHNHDASSRSHAIFSIQYTQAILENNLPSEIVSKINLVDLAGSERADPNYCRDRITEGANINKSLVTLGIVISALAQNSQMCSSSQSINSMVSEGDVSTIGSLSSSVSSSCRRHCFIPYRDSILTWLLKDSLGGNSKTIMIATISPSYSSYNETLSTLRYAAHAKNIVNKPRVNEDANVRLIRELREEIDRLKNMLLNFSMRNPSPSLSDERESSISDIVLQNELKVEQLTKDWSEGWRDKRSFLEQYNVDINQDSAGVQIHSLLPHLISLEPDVLSTEVTIYHLREGVTRIVPRNANEKDPHTAESLLQEGSVCEIENQNEVVTLRPPSHSVCMVNSREVTEPCRLAQGAVITLGGGHKYRFNHPAEAAVLRKRRREELPGLLTSYPRIAEVGSEEPNKQLAPRQRLEEHQHYMECLWEKIQVEQRQAEKDLEREQAQLQQQRTEIQQWILQEKHRLATIRDKGTLDSGVQTDFIPLPALDNLNQKLLNEVDCETLSPSLIVGDRKRVVQEELLKHHALRKNENRVRRKRLHYQLERIARKRHLLEAKQELQRLESNLSVRAVESSFQELGSSSKRRGYPMAFRRHSFSADLLLRLYPQHTPIFSQFLRRNRLSESTSSLCTSTTSRKWVSDENIPERTRARSNTMPSIGGQKGRICSSENIRILKSEDTTGEITDRKVSKSQLQSSVWSNHTEDQNISPKTQVGSNRDTKQVLPIIKQTRTQKNSIKGGKTLTPQRNKSLETICKAFSRSLGSGIKTALSRVFRKPPLGLQSGKSTKCASKAKTQFVVKENKVKALGGVKKREQKSVRPAMSCDVLDELKSLPEKKQGRWHSAETLNKNCRTRLMMEQEQNNNEEDTDCLSDCDSLFSVDSLSSAYANALAEQLQQEDGAPSGTESENSHMSKDSLSKPALELSHSVCHSLLPKINLQSTIHQVQSKEMAAEMLWSVHGSQVKDNNEIQMAKESSQPSQIFSETIHPNGASVRDTENLLALTDVWSSTDATESPRNLKVSEALLKQALCTPLPSCSSQGLSSLNLSGEINESGGQTLDSLEAFLEVRGATVKDQSHKSSEREAPCASSNPISPLSFTPESPTVHENKGLLSNNEAQYIFGESSSYQDIINHTSSKNKPMLLKSVPVKTTDEAKLMINSHSNLSDITQDGSSPECLPEKSPNKDLQSRFLDQAVFIGTSKETAVKQQEKTQSQKIFAFQLASGPSNNFKPGSEYGLNTPLENGQCDETLQLERKIPKSICSSEDLNPAEMSSLKIENFSHESQNNLELFNEMLRDGKTLVQYQGVSDNTDSCETKNAKDNMLKVNGQLSATEVADCVSLEYDSCNAQYKHSRKRSKDSCDLLKRSNKIPKICGTELVAICDPAIDVMFKLNATLSSSRVTTEKLSAVESSDNSYHGYNKRVYEQKSKSVSVNTSSKMCQKRTEYRPALTSTKQQKISKHQMNENNNCVEVMAGEECGVSKPQICLTVNEKISEVVKDHLNMLFVDDSKDIHRNQERNKKSTLFNMGDLKNTQVKNDSTTEGTNIKNWVQSPPDTLPYGTNSDTSDDNSSSEKCFLERCSTKKSGVLGIEFKTNCTPRSVPNMDILESVNHNAIRPVPNSSNERDLDINPKKAIILHGGSIDHDSLKTKYFDVLTGKVNMDRKIPTHVTSLSTYAHSVGIISNPELTTSADILKCKKYDQFVKMQAETLPNNKACQNLTSTGISVRIEKCELDLPSYIQAKPELHVETTSFAEISKESSDVLVSNQCAVVNHIAANMHKEAKNSKYVEESKENMAGEFQKDISTNIDIDTDSEFQKIECLFNSNISYNNAEHFQATDSRLCKLAHQECAQGNPSKEQFFSHDYDMHNTHISNDRKDPSMNPEEYSFVDHKKTLTISNPCEHLVNISTSPGLQGDNKTHITHSRKTFNCLQPSDQSDCKESYKDCRGKNKKESGNVKKENRLQFRDSSILTEHLKRQDPDKRVANKSEPKILNTSLKTESLMVKLKYPHKVKIENLGVDEHTRKSSAKLKFFRTDDERLRPKPKRYKRLLVTAPLSSSTDSMRDSSLDEIAKTKDHNSTEAISVKNCNLAIESSNMVSENRAIPDDLIMPQSSAISPRLAASILNDNQSLGSCAGTFMSCSGVTRDVSTDVVEEVRFDEQRQIHLSSKHLQIPAYLSVDDEAVHLSYCNSSEDTSLVNNYKVEKESKSIPNREHMIHFTSSDINPFIYARKGNHLLADMHKNQSFQSAINISRQISPPESSDKVIARCFSVDNGLNVQNSSFNTHFGMYAVQKGLSSTLSSAEDSKEHVFTEPQLNKRFETPFICKEKTIAISSSDSNSGTLELGQADEIVLVLSTEHEAQQSKQDLGKCEYGTQTVRSEDLKKNCRHRRSSTQGSVSRQACAKSTTWTSLQNMSEHLSELIVSTSDLLGNIQCMRSGKKALQYGHPLHNITKNSKICPDEYGKNDGSTQTAKDIGIQTEDIPLSVNQKGFYNRPSVENTKPQEVNVIIKVIGPEICSIQKQGGICRNQCENKQSFENIKCIPVIQLGGSSPSELFGGMLEALKDLSLETVPNQKCSTTKVSHPDTVEHITCNPSCNRSEACAHGRCTSEILPKENEGHEKLKSKSSLDKQVNTFLVNRASSPILTVDVSRSFQKEKTTFLEHLSNHTKSTMSTETKLSRTPDENKQISNPTTNSLCQKDNFCKICKNKPMSLENLSLENFTDKYGSEAYSTEISLSNRCTQNEIKKHFHDIQSKGVSPRILFSPIQSFPVKHKKHEDHGLTTLQCTTLINERYGFSPHECKHRQSKDMPKCWSENSKNYLQYPDQDNGSLAPSECNTDILLSFNPLNETSLHQEDQGIPENLPMHNKFTNWSGINQQPLARILNEKTQIEEKSPDIAKSFQRHLGSHGYRQKSEFLKGPDGQTKEIQRLQKEREQVLASMYLDRSPHQLSVELTEARLHYGLGETDTLLKMLKSSSRVDSTNLTKQQHNDRHRRSIDGLRKEREPCLQMARRARSLSPMSHTNSSSHGLEQPQQTLDLPSRQKEYLQHLRREVVEMSRVPDPPRREGQCPSDIELLLRDYNRAREEAKVEIARARMRLRERTEQEKRTIKQQVLAQAVRNDLRHRTHVSNSTLCTGSNLSLSSGPTSGYNSSNAALPKGAISPSMQITDVSDPGLRIKTRPPVKPCHGLKTSRTWLSVQDIRLENTSTVYELQSSSPSSHPARERTCSFGSPSSITIPYKDIADSTITSAITEVHLASGGDIRNLLSGKAEAGWKHQGLERGVHTFHRPSPRPSAHGFLGAMELNRTLTSLISVIRAHSQTHLYNKSLKSAWTRSLDERTQLVYLLTDPSNCQLKQLRDFCCLSTETRQDDLWVLAMQSVFEESLPRPSVDTVRGEMFPSAWILQPSQRQGQDVVHVIYLLQVDLGTPSLPQRLINRVARKQAAIIADLDSFLSL